MRSLRRDSSRDESLQNSCQKRIDKLKTQKSVFICCVNDAQNYLLDRFFINYLGTQFHKWNKSYLCYDWAWIISVTSLSHETEARVSGSSNGEEDLWSLWGRIVTNWETEWKRRNQFVRDLVRQGVPHHFRGIVWQLLAGAEGGTPSEKKLYSSYIKVLLSLSSDDVIWVNECKVHIDW